MNNIPDRLKEMIDFGFDGRAARLAAASGISQSNISRWVKGSVAPTYDKLRPLEKLGYNVDWILFGKGEMKIAETQAVQNYERRGVPFYDLDVTASYVESFNDMPEIPKYYIDFKPMNDCDAYFPIFGESMYPLIKSGDIIAVKQFTNVNRLLWGEVYLIITTAECNNLRTIKKVYPGKDKEHIILRAVNPNFNGDLEINVNEIYKIFIVKGSINQFTI